LAQLFQKVVLTKLCVDYVRLLFWAHPVDILISRCVSSDSWHDGNSTGER